VLHESIPNKLTSTSAGGRLWESGALTGNRRSGDTTVVLCCFGDSLGTSKVLFREQLIVHAAYIE